MVQNHIVTAYGMKWMAGPQSYTQFRTNGDLHIPTKEMEKLQPTN